MKFRLVTRPADLPSRRTLAPIRLTIPTRPSRILDLDCEARPLHWIAHDYVSKEITAMAWAWTDRPDDVTCYLLGETDPVTMLKAFLEVYNQADMVTGHYIRGYDLPLINGALTEYGLPILADKLAHDTKIDFIRRAGLSSSQENLGTLLGLAHPKIPMDQAKWRAANRLEPAGLVYVKERVVGDIRQHIELRERMLALGYLGRPKLWKSQGSVPLVPYTP